MNASRLAGHLLLWCGFLVGAFLTVRNSEVPQDPWSTISWPAYGVALAVAVAGVVLLRRTKQAARDEEAKAAGDVAEMLDILKRMDRQLQHWQTDEGKLPVHQVHQQIDQRLTDDLAAFAERRESLIDAFGLEHYARIMTQFALAERTINRMWSASADGYIDEVDTCLTRASAHLEKAIQQLTTAGSP